MLFETARLTLRHITLADAPFLQGLVTEEGWLRWIGSRNVETLADAEGYIREGLLPSHAEHGHGLYLVVRKEDGESVGMCGLLRRKSLDAPDLGYAIGVRYSGLGYATEAARATLLHARDELGVSRVLAITALEHVASHRVLAKVGLRRKGNTAGGNGECLALFEVELTPAGS